MADLALVALGMMLWFAVAVRMLCVPLGALRRTLVRGRRREVLAAAHWAAVRHADADVPGGDVVAAVMADADVDRDDARAAIDLTSSLRSGVG